MDRRAQPGGRPVRVDRQQDDDIGPRGVRPVDPRAGADEPVMRLGDQQRSPPPHDPAALAQHELSEAGIAVRSRQLPGSLGRGDGGQIHETALGLGDRLVRHDHHVAVHERRGGGQQHPGKVLSRPDLTVDRERQDLERHATAPAASRAVRASRSRAAASRMIVSATTARMPWRSTAPASSASCWSMTRASTRPA